LVLKTVFGFRLSVFGNKEAVGSQFSALNSKMITESAAASFSMKMVAQASWVCIPQQQPWG
jgi:hypothetical protein